MKPSILVKSFGFKSFKEFSEYTEIPEQTLFQWHKNNSRLFDLVLLGAHFERCLDAKTRFLTPPH